MKFLIIVAIIFTTQSAHAEGPCLADFKKFCPKIEKNKQNIVKCILANEAKLSPSCKKKAQVMKTRVGNTKHSKNKNKGKKGKQAS
jgi:hypothetical protein